MLEVFHKAWTFADEQLKRSQTTRNPLEPLLARLIRWLVIFFLFPILSFRAVRIRLEQTISGFCTSDALFGSSVNAECHLHRMFMHRHFSDSVDLSNKLHTLFKVSANLLFSVLNFRQHNLHICNLAFLRNCMCQLDILVWRVVSLFKPLYR